MSEIKGIFAVLEEMSEKAEEKEVTHINLDECKNEGKGFKTLIPDEAYAKCKELMKVHEELMHIMADNAPNTISKVFSFSNEEITYAMMEYVMFNDMLKDTWDKITDLVAIHEYADKEEMKKSCEKHHRRPEDVLRTKIMSDILGSVLR